MIAAGIDLGGSKIAVELFDRDWQRCASHRVPTPTRYDDLVGALAALVAWSSDQAGKSLPVGIGSAGLVNPATGKLMAANLAAAGHPLAADIAKAVGHAVPLLNDGRALALSEAMFGWGQGHRTVLALVVGTGIGGGLTIGGSLAMGPTGTGGEFGHMPAPAHLVAAHDLPLVPCGCGRIGCIETFLSGPGLARIARHVTGLDLSPAEIAARKTGEMAQVWDIWCAFGAELLHQLTLTVDPDIVVLAGGLSQIDGVADDLRRAAQLVQFPGFGVPPIVVAAGGDSSGARGAAYAAWKAQQE